MHTCHISRREEKTHGITGFLTASRRETKTSRKEKNPILNFPKVTILRTVIFRVVPDVAAMIIGRKEKPITSVTGILADVNSGDKIKKVLKLPFNPSHFLDDKCRRNKQ